MPENLREGRLCQCVDDVLKWMKDGVLSKEHNDLQGSLR